MVYLCGVVQDGHQALLDAVDQLQAGAQVLRLQQPHARRQVSALQQSLL